MYTVYIYIEIEIYFLTFLREREREKKKKEMFDNLISTAYKKARLPNTPVLNL